MNYYSCEVLLNPFHDRSEERSAGILPLGKLLLIINSKSTWYLVENVVLKKGKVFFIVVHHTFFNYTDEHINLFFIKIHARKNVFTCIVCRPG